MHRPSTRRVSLRLAAAPAAIAAAAVVVVVVVLLTRSPATRPESTAASTASPASSAAATSTGAAPGRATRPVAPDFPAPPPGAVVFAQQAGTKDLALAITRGKRRTLGLQASYVGPEGNGVKGLDVGFRLDTADGRSRTASATACGPGCYHARVVAPARPTRVVIATGLAHPAKAVFPLPAAWPPKSAAKLVARAGDAWRNLRTLVYHDSLTAGFGVTVHSTWQIVAPDRLAYQTDGAGAAIVIGDRRWDRAKGGSWIAAPQERLHQPVPFWQQAVDAHLLGTVRVHGRPAWRISFFDPATPGWFTIEVDKATLHTVDLRMIATAHFMHDTYGPFDSPIRIEPPKTR